MNFFDKLGKKATETYNATKEKTTQISGELKFKSKINDCRAKIEGEYKKLGKMIYDNRTNGETATEEEIQSVCDSITSLFKEIEQSEEGIRKLKNIRKCENCGAEISMSDGFCSKCGTKQPTVVAVEVQNEPVDDSNAIEVKDEKVPAEEVKAEEVKAEETVSTTEENVGAEENNNTVGENTSEN